MTSITATPLARLENEKRLITCNVKEPGQAPGSFIFRGELAIELGPKGGQPGVEPELKADQVMLLALAGTPELPFYSCHLQSFDSLKPMADVLGDMLGAHGKYFVFCSNLKDSEKYRVRIGNASIHVLALGKNSSYDELVRLLAIDPVVIKKRSLMGRVEVLHENLSSFTSQYEQITYEHGLEIMLPASAAAQKTRT
jgi:hypothetical protein